MCVMNFIISENLTNKNNLKYIIDTTLDPLRKLKGEYTVKEDDERAVLTISLPPEAFQLYKQILSEKIGEIIAINYKYRYFTKYIRTGGIDKNEYEMLIVAIISADLEEDKRYIINNLTDFDGFSIDGFFNFRLKPLKEKWAEIVTYIPTYFTKEKLFEFISYIVCEKSGKKVVVLGDKVYDCHYQRLLRTSLTDNQNDRCKIVREVILSGSNQIELDAKLPPDDEKYLISFFGDKISFKKEKIFKK